MARALRPPRAEPRFARDGRWRAALRGWRGVAPKAREVWFHRLLVETMRVEGLGCDCQGCRGCRDVWSVADAPAAEAGEGGR